MDHSLDGHAGDQHGAQPQPRPDEEDQPEAHQHQPQPEEGVLVEEVDEEQQVEMVDDDAVKRLNQAWMEHIDGLKGPVGLQNITLVEVLESQAHCTPGGSHKQGVWEIPCTRGPDPEGPY